MSLAMIRMEGRAQDDITQATTTITLDPNDIWVHRGPFGRALFVRCEVKTDLDFRAPNSAYKGGSARTVSVSGWVGAPNSAWGTVIPNHVLQYADGFELTIPLRDGDIEALEEQRRHGELYLTIHLTGLAKVIAPVITVLQPAPAIPTSWQPTELVPVASEGSLVRGSGVSIQLGRERWLSILREIGKTRYLIELPVPQVPQAQRDTWNACIDSLRHAEASHRNGDYKDVGGKCRLVAEGIVTVLSAQWNIPRKKPFVNWAKEVAARLENTYPHNREHGQMVGCLLLASWTWTSPMVHYPQGVGQREESSFTLHLITNLLAFASILLDTFPKPILQEASPDEE